MIDYNGARFTVGALIKSFLFSDTGFGDEFCKGNIEVYGDLANFIERNQRKRLLPYLSTTSRNKADHYDLPAAFYEILLGESMSYTCGNWSGRNGITYRAENLERAQAYKHDRHYSWLLGDAAKSDLKILECGCGWGSFMDLLKWSNPKLSVSGLTISKEQSQYIENHYPDLKTVYTASWEHADFHASFDRFAAIGMLEHVGKGKVNDFIAWVERLLKVDGVGTLQFISRDEPISAWADKWIFPGAYPPSFNEVSRALRKNGLRVTDVHECGHDYVTTLEHWLDNLLTNEKQIMALGLPKEFIRMFELYLNGGIVSFRTGASQLIQLRFEK